MANRKNPFWTPWPLPARFNSPPVVERCDLGRGSSLHLCCTQLNDTSAEKKRILNEWLDYLKSKPRLKTLRIGTRCTQQLFDAACQCSELTSLEIHWGPITDLSSIKRLKSLKRLGIGSCSVVNIAPLGQLASLEHLSLGNFDRTEDYSPVAKLKQLNRLLIEGAPMMPKSVWMKNLKFLRNLTNLDCLSLTAIKFRDDSFHKSFRDLNLTWLDLWVDDEEVRQSIIESLPRLRGGRIMESAR